MTPLGYIRAAAASRAVRRLVIAVAALVAADRFEPALLRSLEEARYEDRARYFRFENSDLFALGPLVAYLREHPRGRQPRVLFFGNSIIHGYFLGAEDAIPGRYQRLGTSAKVFNAGINGSETASAFLIAKAVIDSVDLVYVQLRRGDAGANPILPRLIPIEDADLAQFHLTAPNEAERMLSRAVNHWRLYRDAYRLQAALFGTSTREHIYQHKGALVRGLIARLRAAQMDSAPSPGTVTIDAPVSAAVPDARRQAQRREQNPQLWQFADLFMNRRKQAVFLYFPGYSEGLPDDAIGDFNRVCAPYARVLSVGAAQLARALWNARPEDHHR